MNSADKLLAEIVGLRLDGELDWQIISDKCYYFFPDIFKLYSTWLFKQNKLKITKEMRLKALLEILENERTKV